MTGAHLPLANLPTNAWLFFLRRLRLSVYFVRSFALRWEEWQATREAGARERERSGSVVSLLSNLLLNNEAQAEIGFCGTKLQATFDGDPLPRYCTKFSALEIRIPFTLEPPK